MGKFSKIFNFDNIGGKIKNLAKWSCWITILLLWIFAAIGAIIMIADDTPEQIFYIIVIALVGPFVVWIGSWVMYAFGEFVERTCDNEDNTRLILEKLTEDNYDNNYTTAEEVDEDNIAEDYIEDDEPQEYVPSCTEEEHKRKIARIANLRKKGLISEELYQKAINNSRILDKF